MATKQNSASKTVATAVRPEKALPSRKVLHDRLEKIRTRLWHVRAVCHLASQAGDLLKSLPGAEKRGVSVWVALQGTVKELDKITSELDPRHMLRIEREVLR